MNRRTDLLCWAAIIAALVFFGCGGKTEETRAPGAPSVTAQPSGGGGPAAEAQPPAEGSPAVSAQAPAAGGLAKPWETGVVLAAQFNSASIKNGAPEGWNLDAKSGTPVVRLEGNGKDFCLHLSSDSESSFGIKKAVKVDIREYPFLNWRWKVTRLPVGGDVRKASTDAQVLQVYVAFPATGWPEKLNTPVVGYIWDNEAPRGWMGRSPHLGGGMLRYVVVRNKTDKTGEWYTEKRNLYDDYQRLFKDVKGGRPLGPTKGIQLYINSQHTRSAAEGYVCEVYFSKS